MNAERAARNRLAFSPPRLRPDLRPRPGDPPETMDERKYQSAKQKVQDALGAAEENSFDKAKFAAQAAKKMLKGVPRDHKHCEEWLKLCDELLKYWRDPRNQAAPLDGPVDEDNVPQRVTELERINARNDARVTELERINARNNGWDPRNWPRIALKTASDYAKSIAGCIVLACAGAHYHGDGVMAAAVGALCQTHKGVPIDRACGWVGLN